LTPTLPMPQGADKGCGTFGTIIMVAIAVVVTIYTAGALSGAGFGFVNAMSAGTSVLAGGTATGVAASVGLSGMSATVATAAVAGMAGSAVSQLAGMAMGNVDKFDWKGVALSGISAGVTAGVGSAFTPASGALSMQAADVAGRAMMSNALTQGIAVKTGLTDTPFSWKGVAAAGAGAYVGSMVNAGIGDRFNGMGETLGGIARGTVSGFAAGVTTAVMRGGRIATTQIAADAFGNALGSSLARENVSGKSEKSGLEFWAKLQVAKEDSLMNTDRNSSGDPIADYVNRNFGFDMSGGASGKADSYMTSASFNFGGAQNTFSSIDVETGYTGFADLGRENGVNKYGVTYHYGEGERDQLRLERNAIALERMGQQVQANTNASMMGVTAYQRNADMDADIAAGRTGTWDAVRFAASYTARKVGYEVWNIATAGFVGRHDDRLQAQAEGRLSGNNLWRATAIDGVTSVASVWAGGRVGTVVAGRLGTGYLGNMGTGASVGAAFDLVQQAGGNGIYAATNGQSGRSGFSLEEFGTSTAFGAVLGGGAKVLTDFGNYRFQMTPYRPGTLYSNPMPFELVAPEGSSVGANGVSRYGRFASVDKFAEESFTRYQRYTDEAYAATLNAYNKGRLIVPDGMSPETIIGQRTDAVARIRMSRWLGSEGIAEGSGEGIQLNRWLRDPSGSGLYRIPDVRIPEANLIMDGTIGYKWQTTPQVADFYRFSGGSNVTIVRPTQLGGSYNLMPQQ